MEDIAGWVAPVTTMIAAMMTASNLGPRVTGWGFAVFSLGSIAWIIVAMASGQQNLLWSNAFLAMVNMIGIWRWLGRRARYDDGGKAAAEGSRAASAPALFPLSGLEGMAVAGPDGHVIAHVIDAMAECGDGRISYVVVREGGVAGLGETLHAIGWNEMTLSDGRIETGLSAARLRARRPLDPRHWPARREEADALS
ncbi:photosystem reaction center subunit H [Sphingomonas oleivorans]|uniref:Photosystem reaction center subunit H n=1 Tax=Sphingomonas oleivorans TaxID=1735121 RepID=A0A2T5FWH0_9SPHN|nr:PRC-barrel domain-containing protein [Sphingomonas oleivorans]PTQ10131.1 photosystem reaction center subunit H [Sphingomonas oleivorans]